MGNGGYLYFSRPCLGRGALGFDNLGLLWICCLSWCCGDCAGFVDGCEVEVDKADKKRLVKWKNGEKSLT